MGLPMVRVDHDRRLRHGARRSALWRGQLGFLPVVPAVSRFIWTLFPVSPQLALEITGNAAFLLAILTLYLYGLRQFGEDFARTLVVVTCFTPYSIYFATGMTEAPFLFLCVLAVLLWVNERFLLAGIAAALAGATRSFGLFLVLPFVVLAIQDGVLARLWHFGARELRMLNGILLVPAGVALFSLYLHARTGDALAWAHVQVAWSHSLTNPWRLLMEIWHNDEPIYQYFAWIASLGLLLAAYLVLRRRFAEAAFMLAGILLPLSSGQPFAFPRHLSGLFPTYIALTLLVRQARLPLPLVIGVLAMLDGLVVVSWVTARRYVQ
jgi:hypothetical protein